MGFGAALLAMSAVQAVGQIGAGYAQKAEADYNASVLESQEMLLNVEKDIEQGRFVRKKGQILGKSMTAAAGMGVVPEGSPLAAMISTQTQLNIDQAINNFNFEREKAYLRSQADSEKRRGKAARRAGWSNAFSTMLQAGSDYAMYKTLRSPAKTQEVPSTFDSYQDSSNYKLRGYFSANTSLPKWAY